MKNFKIALIVILACLMLGLCTLLVMGLNGSLFQGGEIGLSGSYQLVSETEIPLEGVEIIDVSYQKNNSDIYVYEGSGDSVVIREYANFEIPEDKRTAIERSGNMLTVAGKRYTFFGIHFFGFGGGDRYTEIYLPKNWKGDLSLSTASGSAGCDFSMDLTKLKVGTASGDIRMDRITAAGEAEFTTASGNLQIEELDAEKVYATTASGDINMGSVAAAGDAKFTTASGNHRIEQVIAKTAGFSSASGDISLQSLTAENSNIKTSSGVVRILDLESSLKCTTASGDVVLSVSGSNGFSFEAETVSGDIGTWFDDELSFSKRGDHAQGDVGDASFGRTIHLETASGNIRILEK